MAAIKTSQEKTTAAMKMLDAQLGKTQYVAGTAFSYGDIPVGIMCYRFVQLVPQRPPMPNLDRWYGAISSAPGVQGSRRQRSAVVNAARRPGRCLGLDWRPRSRCDRSLLSRAGCCA